MFQMPSYILPPCPPPPFFVFDLNVTTILKFFFYSWLMQQRVYLESEVKAEM